MAPAPDGTPGDPAIGPPGSPFDRPAAPQRERIWDLCLAIAAGGALGGAARYGVNTVLPAGSSGFPWSTFVENTTGSFVLAALMVYLMDVWPPNRYLRPFLGVGVLGGFTTFSAYTSETRALLQDGHAPTALLYLFASPALGALAAFAGITTARAVSERGRRSAG